MVSNGTILEMFQRVCVGDKRYIGLIFRAPDEKQGGFGTVKFIGKNDSLENALIIAEHIGKECVALIEMDRLESSFLDASRGKRRSSMMRVQEAICSKIGAAVLQAE